MPKVAAHEDELAEPPIDKEGANYADYHDDQDYGALVEDVYEEATVCLVSAQEEPAVRRKTCQGIAKRWRQPFFVVSLPLQGFNHHLRTKQIEIRVV